jgi:hypothetical protein
LTGAAFSAAGEKDRPVKPGEGDEVDFLRRDDGLLVKFVTIDFGQDFARQPP